MCASAGRRLPWEIGNVKSASKDTPNKRRSRKQETITGVTPSKRKRRQRDASVSDDELERHSLDQDRSPSPIVDNMRNPVGIQNAEGDNAIDDGTVENSSNGDEEIFSGTDAELWMEMVQGDEKYRMVEDEFFDVARECAASLHAAELADLKSQASDRTSSQQRDDLDAYSNSTLLVPNDFGADKTSKLALLMTSPIKQAADLDTELQSPTTIRRRPAKYQMNSTADSATEREGEKEGDIVDQLLRDPSVFPNLRNGGREMLRSSDRRTSSALKENSFKMSPGRPAQQLPRIDEGSPTRVADVSKSSVHPNGGISEPTEVLPKLTPSKKDRRNESNRDSLSERVALRRANILKGTEEPDFITEFLQSEPIYTDSSREILSRRISNRSRT
ncbi:hypothetical protein V1525DRAFT_108898 [Lipomyces kononenkoae]|uniref:Uncharacterized protein n=1 Tax=Lipomyces kononenkoae TaxID=34357 RepID=A0ACC3T4D0_LIPKO